MQTIQKNHKMRQKDVGLLATHSQLARWKMYNTELREPVYARNILYFVLEATLA